MSISPSNQSTPSPEPEIESRLSFLEGKVEASKQSKGGNLTLIAAIVAAAIGFVSQSGVAWYNAYAEQALEAQKLGQQLLLENQRLQQQLLLDAVRVDVQTARKNLLFLLDTDLIRESDFIDIARLKERLDKGGSLSIPVQSERPSYLPTANTGHCGVHLSFGYPSLENVICRKGFALSYDPVLKGPRWVSYRLAGKREVPPRDNRHRYRADPDIAEGYDPEIYRGSGFHRGHLVPNSDVRWDADSAHEVNFLSNITPQIPAFNIGIWVILERRVRGWAEVREELVIVSGPVFSRTPTRYLRDTVAIPDQFFKIVFDPVRSQVLAFLIPHTEEAGRTNDPAQYLVSIDRVEEITGLEIFGNMPQEMQEQLEETRAGHLWE